MHRTQRKYSNKKEKNDIWKKPTLNILLQESATIFNIELDAVSFVRFT
jgi:hypothetical protein